MNYLFDVALTTGELIHIESNMMYYRGNDTTTVSSVTGGHYEFNNRKIVYIRTTNIGEKT